MKKGRNKYALTGTHYPSVEGYGEKEATNIAAFEVVRKGQSAGFQ